MNNVPLECELKYSAETIELIDFKKLVEQFKPTKEIDISSYDFYFTNDKNEFIRYRKSENRPEITVKTKTSNLNNNIRKEVNLEIDKEVNEKTVEAFVTLLGYKLNFTIYKTCVIYYLDKVNTVWYKVFNENMDEIGKFLEIEINPEIAEQLNEVQAMELLKEWEQKLSSLGISPQSRLKQSLFERYRK